MCVDTLGDFHLAILAKAPIPGKVKTRLVPAIGEERAARLHERLLRYTLGVALGATACHRITLWTALVHDHPLFLELAARHGIALRPQPQGDLGERMYHALASMDEPGLLIGSDCPVLTTELLRRCHAALQRVDAVVLPAEDGGYALIGLKRADPRLFTAIDWGTQSVMARTRERIAELGWHMACPAVVWDVDRPEDLERVEREFPDLLSY